MKEVIMPTKLTIVLLLAATLAGAAVGGSGSTNTTFTTSTSSVTTVITLDPVEAFLTRILGKLQGGPAV